MKKLHINRMMMGVAAVASAFFIGVTPITAMAYCDESAETEAVEITEEATEEEEMGPLTPDGNLDLVDDYGSTEGSGKQFITVVTKKGNYFYIIIDRDDNGNENVHFLNMVDERDLLSLMDDEEKEELLAEVEVVEEPEVVPDETEEPEVETPKAKFNTNYLILIPIAVIGIALIIFKFKKSKTKPKKPVVDPDAGYDEDEDNILNELPDEDEVDEAIEEDYGDSEE